MLKCTFIGAAALILLGVAVYFVSGTQSATALIPSFLGLPIAVAGLIALKESLRMHAMHAAVILAVLGVLGGLGMGVPAGIGWVLNGETKRPTAVVTQLLMGSITLAMLVVYVRSFIAARRARKAGSVPSDADGSKATA